MEIKYKKHGSLFYTVMFSLGLLTGFLIFFY